MYVIVDVQYTGTGAMVGYVYGEEPQDAHPVKEFRVQVGSVAPYVPGSFYQRELPCILVGLDTTGLDLIVIDGYVWLDIGREGLGIHLHRAVGIPVLGVAKTSFKGNRAAVEVFRGASKRPLYVTSVGVVPPRFVEEMHGPHRLPTLIGRADALARGR